jgi:uncharacterized membrane protein YgcG
VDETTVDGVDGSVAPLQPGDPRRLGSYELIGRLGVGGQGAVFLGTPASGERVAVKLLHPDLTQDTDARGRFVREAMAAKQVARFCAAQVLDVQVAGDRPYIVSEYVPGPSLYRLIKDGGPLSGGPLERLAIGTATALVAIHQAGIVHRDLKPANVLVGPDGPRVIDFGIAKALATTATATSRILGTPAYMAPEQVRGEPVDASADVFAWGALMAFVATGSPPFGTDSIPLVVQRIVGDDPDLTDMVEPLRGLVSDCLAKEPAIRPTARQILLRLLGQEETAAPPVAPTVAAGQVAPVAAGQVAPVDRVAAAADAVATDVLAQAATIAGVRPAAARAASAASAASSASAAPVAKWPALSRAFVAAGLAAVVVAIVALVLMATKPYGTPKDPGGNAGTSPAGQGESVATKQYGQQGTGRPRDHAPTPAGGTTQQANTGTSGHGGTGHPTPTPTWTPTVTPTWTPTATPTLTPTETPTLDSGGGSGGGSDESGGSGSGSGGDSGGGPGSTDGDGTHAQ